MLEGEERERVEKALLKRALGYDFEEVTEEFSLDEESGKMTKNKVKISKKHSPADMNAVKTLISIYDDNNENRYELMTEEELLKEKEKLLNELSECENIKC